ncbi:uncharacterized protein BDV14DRAFT_205618 [Aspergillus stella-maris]|uniref:uncharacterized protein n=1 Tax=Aspergillus stella-maris TaxID=1810926 RepID=UPI003CCDAA73
MFSPSVLRLCSFLSLTLVTNAAVTFYGAQGRSSDHVECSIGNGNATSDKALATVFATVYKGGGAVTNTTIFRFDDADIFACIDFNATSTCVPGGTDSEATLERGRSAANLKKRVDSPITCNEWSGECRNQYQPQGTCASGY